MERDELFSEPGVNLHILLDLISKEVDQDGKVNLRWGSAKIA